ncbi:MAG: prepilin peptidase [Lachnospiraceae bacterium]|nr:prepilin peptidase [Lachnospiraceae bacterium]
MSTVILLYIIVFTYGLLIGSFLNVLIYRIPKKENIAIVRSHCMKCGYQLRWYDLVPLFSWIFLGGRCRQCKEKISFQYPLIEAVNGVFYVVVFYHYGLSIESLLYCLLFSALLALSVIDFRTYEIPVGFNYFILILGLIRLVTDLQNWSTYCIGFLVVSGFLYLLVILSGGRAMGGGDVKLMATCGLLIGWKLIILAFFVGCVLGSVIHVIRMKVSKQGHVLAMGPYLSMGIAIAVLYGEPFLNWYLNMFFTPLL